jgi:hypothetical protein
MSEPARARTPQAASRRPFPHSTATFRCDLTPSKPGRTGGRASHVAGRVEPACQSQRCFLLSRQQRWLQDRETESRRRKGEDREKANKARSTHSRQGEKIRPWRTARRYVCSWGSSNLGSISRRSSPFLVVPAIIHRFLSSRWAG